MKVLNKQNKKIAALVICFLGLVNTSMFAQDVPANLQAALFKKIFAFDKTLASKGVEVGVLGDNGDEIIAAFKTAGVSAKAVSAASGVTVLYLMPGTSAAKQQTASKGILSIAGQGSLAEEGKVAIAIGLEGGKPKILVNMAQLKAEGQELSADLLKIAKVIQ